MKVRKRDISSANHNISKNNRSFYAFTLYVFTYFFLLTILHKNHYVSKANLRYQLPLSVVHNCRQRRFYMHELFKTFEAVYKVIIAPNGY